MRVLSPLIVEVVFCGSNVSSYQRCHNREACMLKSSAFLDMTPCLQQQSQTTERPPPEFFLGGKGLLSAPRPPAPPPRPPAKEFCKKGYCC